MNWDDYENYEIKDLTTNKGGRPVQKCYIKTKYVKWSKELLLYYYKKDNKRTDFSYIQNELCSCGDKPTFKQINHWFKNERRRDKIKSLKK